MKRTAWFMAVFNLIICLFLSGIERTWAQSELRSAEERWALPPVDCGRPLGACEIRVSLEGDLYILARHQAMLYVSRQGETTYRGFNLQPYVRWISGGVLEFVPYSDQNVVVFYGSADRTLSRLDLMTGEMTQMPQNDTFRQVILCNGYTNRTGSHHHISRLRTGTQLLFCAISNQGEFHLGILDVLTQETLCDYKFPLSSVTNGNARAWDMLLGGEDGNIYIDLNGFRPKLAWESVVGPLPDLPEWGWRLLRYEVSSGTWSAENIVPEQMASLNYPPRGNAFFERIESVMSNGDILYLNVWSEENSSDVVELSHYDSNFQFVDRISSEELNSPFSYLGVSSEGLVLLRTGAGLESLMTVQLSMTPDIDLN